MLYKTGGVGSGRMPKLGNTVRCGVCVGGCAREGELYGSGGVGRGRLRQLGDVGSVPPRTCVRAGAKEGMSHSRVGLGAYVQSVLEGDIICDSKNS